ncbi:MAG: hypothetical protein Q7U54_20630 [Bacteroidales bacterium]|nr:hypothetical protein [Bacteroidales bacterium]
MGFSLITSYSFWFLLLCILAGATYAGLLYFHEKDNDFSLLTTRILSILRGTTVTFIAFLLLSPLLKSTSRYTEKPIVLLALDNSGSIVLGKDSSFYKNEFMTKYRKLADDLSNKYEVQTYTFGDKINRSTGSAFTEKQTNMESLFNEIRDSYSNRNLAALILASDGIYNQGTDPLYVSDNAPYSIYTIAMGDTVQQKDIKISRINYNRIAFLGNDFPVEITVTAFRCLGAISKISVASGDQQLYTENFSIGQPTFSHTFTTRLTASKTGIQRYRIAVPAIPGEISTTNNFQEIFVEVLDSRQKILLVQASPHPDVAALKQAIEKNRNYSVDNFMLSDFNGSIALYSLVILHQIPSVNNVGFQVTNQLKSIPVPVLYIIGSQSNIPAYNSLMTGLQIPSSLSSFNEATGMLNPDFSLFSPGSEIERMIQEFPPLSVPFSQYKPGTAAQVLLYQKIGAVNTRIPLILFNQGVDRKSATITGEGIWRWRLANFAKAGNQQVFDELFTKIIQYLAVKEDKSQFRVILKNSFTENEAVEIDAELYNDSYQLVNEPDVNIVITDGNKKIFPFAFTRTSNAYYLNSGSLPPGEYSYKATTTFAGKAFQKTGMFTVIALNVESMNTVANHVLLSNIANRHKGKMVYPDQMEDIVKLLAARDDLKTVAYTQKRYTDLVSFLPVLLLLLGLLSSEWFIRKRNGSY